MRAPTDLHPDDRAYRVGLRNLLTGRRHELGVSQAALAKRIGVSQYVVASAEVGQPHRVNASQRHARGLDLRVIAYPEGVPGYHDNDAALDLLRPSDSDDADRWDRQRLLAALVSARRAAGITQAVLAGRLGIAVNVLGRFERTAEAGLMWATCQRYCRASGGELWIGVEPIEQNTIAIPLMAGVA